MPGPSWNARAGRGILSDGVGTDRDRGRKNPRGLTVQTCNFVLAPLIHRVRCRIALWHVGPQLAHSFLGLGVTSTHVAYSPKTAGGANDLGNGADVEGHLLDFHERHASQNPHGVASRIPVRVCLVAIRPTDSLSD